MYVCRNFKAYEFVDRETYRLFGESSFRFFDAGLLKVADWLRDQLGPCTVNDWYWRKYEHAKDVFEWSGLRLARWDEIDPHPKKAEGKRRYSPYSDHALGSALDMKFKNHTAEYVRQFIKDNFDKIKEETGVESLTLEEGVSWLHLATRNNNNGVNSFYP